MAIKIIVEPSAEIEIFNTIEYYNQKKAFLGDRFYNELSDLFDHLQKFPNSFAIRYNNSRVGVLKNFPYLFFIPTWRVL